MTNLLFYLFASLSLGGGIGTVRAKNPVASLLFLVVTFFSLAAIYVLLEAHFIAAVQIIVYAGAIMVLFLFVIMLLNLGHDYRSDLRGGLWLLAAFAAVGLTGGLLANAFLQDDAVVDAGGALLVDTAVREMNAVGAIAQPLMRDYVVPFEVTSLLLLVAIIGAVLLAKRRV